MLNNTISLFSSQQVILKMYLYKIVYKNYKQIYGTVYANKKTPPLRY